MDRVALVGRQFRPFIEDVDDVLPDLISRYVTSALITAPSDYQQNWSQYRLDIAAGGQRMAAAAPAPDG